MILAAMTVVTVLVWPHGAAAADTDPPAIHPLPITITSHVIDSRPSGWWIDWPLGPPDPWADQVAHVIDRRPIDTSGWADLVALAESVPCDWEPRRAALVAARETGGQAVQSPANTNGTRDWGRWQVNDGYGRPYDWGRMLTDPAYDVAVACKIWAEAGGTWKPWCPTVYTGDPVRAAGCAPDEKSLDGG